MPWPSDVYESDERTSRAVYARRKTVDPVKAEKRLREALSHLQLILEVPASHIHYKLRRAQRPGAQ